MVNCFTFVQKSILLSSRNNFKILYTLEIYLHKVKLISLIILVVHEKYVFAKICTYLVPLLHWNLREICFRTSGKAREFYFEVSVWTLYQLIGFLEILIAELTTSVIISLISCNVFDIFICSCIIINWLLKKKKLPSNITL